MIDHEQLVRQAAADDAAAELRRCADRLARVAGKLDALSEAKILRMVVDLLKTADLKRPKIGPQRVPISSLFVDCPHDEDGNPVSPKRFVRPPC